MDDRNAPSSENRDTRPSELLDTRGVEEPAPTASAFDLAGKKLGEFRLLKEIGRGGMGVVYEAIQESLNRTVAVKILPAGLKIRQEFIERFDLEAKAVARLHHPNIMTVYGFGFQEGTYYFAMEYIVGKSLETLLRESTTIAIDKCLEYALQIGNALKYAHENGVIHRDIKPGNILIESSSARVIVTDFGIAKVMYGFPTSVSATVLGTPEYMSPEQASGEETDQRTDVYSLGLLLYQMTTGIIPFHSDSFLKTIEKVKLEMLIPPTRFNPKVPATLEFIILKAMERDPARRYRSIEDMVADLQAFSHGLRPKLFAKARQLRLARRIGLSGLLGAGLLVAAVFAYNFNTDPIFRENALRQSRVFMANLSGRLAWLLPFRPAGPMREVVKLVEAEDSTIRSGGDELRSDYASNFKVMLLGLTGDGDYLTFSLKFVHDVYDASIEARYADTAGGNNILLFFDNSLVGQFTSKSTTQSNPLASPGFSWSPVIRIGFIPAGMHEIQTVVSGGSNGVYLDYLLIRGNVPGRAAPVHTNRVENFQDDRESQPEPAAAAIPAPVPAPAPGTPATAQEPSQEDREKAREAAALRERQAFEQLKREILDEQEQRKKNRTADPNASIQTVNP